KVRIDLHAAAIIERNAGFFQSETVGVGHATDAHQHDVCLQRLRLPTRCGLDRCFQRLARSVDAGDLGAELELETLPFEDALELPRDLAIHARQDAIEE